MLEVREGKPGDGSGCARAWLGAGRYYAALDPVTFQVPASDGLAPSFDADLERRRELHRMFLVADDRGEVLGFVAGALDPAHDDAQWELLADLARPRLLVNALVVAEKNRRHGVGTALLAAAERWGRDRGAAVVVLDTNLNSPLSVPFYEQRMGYVRRSVIFRKSLT